MNAILLLSPSLNRKKFSSNPNTRTGSLGNFDVKSVPLTLSYPDTARMKSAIDFLSRNRIPEARS